MNIITAIIAILGYSQSDSRSRNISQEFSR